MPLLNIIPTNTSFKFMSLRKIGLFFSVTLILISFIAIFVKGLNFFLDGCNLNQEEIINFIKQKSLRGICTPKNE